MGILIYSFKHQFALNNHITVMKIIRFTFFYDQTTQELLGKYQNCHLVLNGSSWSFLVLFLVLFSSDFGSLVQFLY